VKIVASICRSPYTTNLVKTSNGTHISARSVRLRFVSLITLLFASLPGILPAQGLYGSISGTVTDQSGAVVPSAEIAVSNDATGLKRTGSTDANGVYRILDLPGGTYTVSASAAGFKSLTTTNVAVVIGQVNQQNLQLQLGAAAQQVTVEGASAVLQTQGADVHTEISSFAIQNLPLNVYRNFQAVTLLAPGVFSMSAIADSYPNGLASGPERSMSIYSNGIPSHSNTTRVDGATDLNVWLPDHMLIVPPQETIQEVNVQTATYDVEKGLTAGAATDVITKSGTNELHGSLYGLHTDNALDARNFFDYNPRKAKRIQNNDGATLGGPIKKNKLFYFLNWDGFWERRNTAGTGLIPTQDYRDGDFTSALGQPLFNATGAPVNVCTTEGGTTQLRQGMVFDPATGNPNNGTGRCVFSSNGRVNVIPGSRLAKGSQNFWPLLPQPNIPGAITANTAFNDFYTLTSKFNRQIGTSKVDWNRSDRHTIWAKWTLQNADVDSPMEHGAAGGVNGYTAYTRTQMATVGHTWTISPNLVLTGHVGFARVRVDAVAGINGQPLGQTLLGVPGTNEPSDDVRYSGLPAVQMAGWDTLGDGDPSTPYTRRDWTATTSHNLTWIRGKHQFRMGFDASHNHLNQFQPELCCMRGALNFAQGNTSINLPADPANPTNGKFMGLYTSATPSEGSFAGTGYSPYLQNSVAAFDLGYMSEVDKSFQYINFTARSWQYGSYFGDRWKVSPKLTLDLGIRWEYYPMLTRNGADQFELYDPSSNTLEFGGIAGNPTHLGVTTSKKLFDPRVGAAYQLRDSTVIRAGFGISNDTMPLERPLRGYYPMVIAASNFVPSSFVSGFIPYTTFAGGIPEAQGPDISSGSVNPPPNVTVGTVAPGEFKRGYVESWNFFIEQRLPGDILLNAGYVGNHFVHELNGQDINAAPLGAGSAGQPLARFGRYIPTYIYQGYLDSHYNSLQVSVNRRTSNGLFLQGAYTYSRTMGYEDDNTYQNNLRFNCPPSPAMPKGCLQLNYGPTSFDHTHVLKMSFVYELPFGTGKRWNSSNRVVNTIVGGWQVNGIFTAMTGDPLSLSQNRNTINTPATPQTPDAIAPAKYVKGHSEFGSYSGIYWFDPSTFVPNLSTDSVGNLPRRLSWLRGPGVVQMDASLFRRFKVKERFELEVRGEALNVTNSTHFSDPNTTCSVVGDRCLGSFGQIGSAFGQRIVQLGAVVRF
jgi:hypothetical protein